MAWEYVFLMENVRYEFVDGDNFPLYQASQIQESMVLKKNVDHDEVFLQ